MANQIEASKLIEHIYTVSPAANISVSKLIMYVFAVPGESGPDTSNKQGHVHSQILRR